MNSQFNDRDLYCLAKLRVGLSLNDEAEGTSDRARPFLDYVGALSPKAREAALMALLPAFGDPGQIIRSLASIDPHKPPNSSMGSEVAKKKPSRTHESREDRIPVPASAIDLGSLSDQELGIVHAVDVEADCVSWYWKHRAERGELSLLSGPGGNGKTQLGLYIASRSTRGEEFPDGSKAPLGRVLIVSAEDSWKTTLKPRLAALGADMTKVTFIQPELTFKGADGKSQVHPQSFQNTDYWSELLRRLKDTSLIFVDPIPSYLGRGVDDHKNNDVRAVLERFISTVIRPSGVLLLATTHSNKNVSAGESVNRVIGSVAYVNLARNVHIVIADPEDSNRSFARQDKSNHAPRDSDAIEFRVAPLDVEVDGKVIPTVTLTEVQMVPRASVAYAFDPPQKTRGRRKGGVKIDQAIRWLYHILEKASPGDMQVWSLVERAREEGILKSPDEENPKPSISGLYKAKDALARLYPGNLVVERKEGRLTFWRLVQGEKTPTVESSPTHSQNSSEEDGDHVFF
jgi:hypothetical protein